MELLVLVLAILVVICSFGGLTVLYYIIKDYDVYMSEKFCIDCKHVRPLLIDMVFYTKKNYTYAKCAKNKSPVDGSPLYSCEQLRQNGGNNCGPEGKYWEPK